MTAYCLNSNDEQLLQLALVEDLGIAYEDITSDLLFSDSGNKNYQAKIISKHPAPIIFSGAAIVKPLLNKLSHDHECHFHIQDGEWCAPSDTLLSIIAPARVMLKAERTLLNFLQRLSGIATVTRQYVDAVRHTSAKILDTRKTTPGLRRLEKYAVQCGGGVNHRMGLYDALMIKDTHTDFLGGIEHSLSQLPDDITQHYPVIVEVRNRNELNIVLKNGLHKTTRVLLDNMNLTELAACVALCESRIATEASGNINLDNVSEVAACGVDFISIGRLTHSIFSADLSMQCDL